MSAHVYERLADLAHREADRVERPRRGARRVALEARRRLEREPR